MKKISFLLILLIIFIKGISQTTVIKKDSIPICSIIFSEFERILDDFIDNEKQFEYFDSNAVFDIVIGLNNDSNIYIMLSSGRKMYDTIFQPESTNKKPYICFYFLAPLQYFKEHIK